MARKSKNVQILDNMLKHIKTKFPRLRFRAKQKITETSAKGWGFRVTRSQTETSIEPIEDCCDERS